MNKNILFFYLFVCVVAVIGGIYFSITANYVGAAICWTTVFWTIATMILADEL